MASLAWARCRLERRSPRGEMPDITRAFFSHPSAPRSYIALCSALTTVHSTSKHGHDTPNHGPKVRVDEVSRSNGTGQTQPRAEETQGAANVLLLLNAAVKNATISDDPFDVLEEKLASLGCSDAGRDPGVFLYMMKVKEWLDEKSQERRTIITALDSLLRRANDFVEGRLASLGSLQQYIARLQVRVDACLLLSSSRSDYEFRPFPWLITHSCRSATICCPQRSHRAFLYERMAPPLSHQSLTRPSAQFRRRSIR